MADMSFRQKIFSEESGVISGMLVAVIGLSILVLGLGSFAIWAFVSFEDASSNLADKVQLAVDNAKEEQSTADQKVALEREKQPFNTFKAPADYCSVKLQY